MIRRPPRSPLFPSTTLFRSVPPPEATAKVTATPLTGLPFASCTITDGSTGTAVPAVADWLFPALRAICVAVPAVPVAVDRKSVVEGKSVDLGGRRIIKKKHRGQDGT